MDIFQAPLYIILNILFIMAGTVMVYFLIKVMKQRHMQQLRRSKGEAEIITLENERKRMAADIHDELGPLLSAAKLKYSLVEVFSSEDRQLLNQGHFFIDEVVTKMRHIARGLVPEALLYKGPVYAVTEFIDHIAADGKLVIEFNPGQVPELSGTQSLHIYRMLQEIIHNTLKHAAASRLQIDMYACRDKLVIRTADDGKGFDYKNKIREGNGLGLYNLQSRAKIINAEVQFRSQAHKGTSFYITIPL